MPGFGTPNPLNGRGGGRVGSDGKGSRDRNERFVVIELKVGKGRNKAVGQLLYYMGWVDKELGKAPCRGLIIAKEIPDDLVLAVQRVPGVSLARYKLSVSVETVYTSP
jgi:endonuclease